MEAQYYVLGSRINLYFQDHKLATEIDKFNHCDRSIDCEIKKQKAIQKEFDSKFIRTNPDENKFKKIKNEKIKLKIKVIKSIDTLKIM